ncbi:MAG: phenylacetate--CoA ligase family protein [bacterium]|nr:phenylacetate--CoA ligase family protein [bacterium]
MIFMDLADRIYRHLPTWAQHGAVSAYGLVWYRRRFGPGFRRYLDEYARRERFTACEWESWQRQRLREVLSTAADHVPHYRERWSREAGKAAREGRLTELPLLDKQPLRAHPESFVRTDRAPRSRLVFHTSGSTGTPIASIWTVEELRRSMALREVRSARWAGVSFKRARATLSGRIVEPDPQSRGPFHRLNLAERQVYFSAFHLSPRTAPRYVEALRRHRVEWLTGYAVSFYLLARFILEQKLDVPPLCAVITTSEKVTPEMRRVMERAYRCRVYEEYSTVENILFASECENGRLHVSPDAGAVEIVRPDGSPCAPGEVGEVVATSLLRDYQPSVRLRLGDLAAWDPEPCPCGRALPVLKEVVGRIEDVVVGPDGREMVRFHGIFVDLPQVREGQIVQVAADRIRIKVVAAPGFGPRDAAEMIARVRQRLGPAVGVEVETVDAIPRTAAGKFQAVVSLIDR